MMDKVSSFWALSAMGVLGSIDEGAVGVSYPFLEIPVLWIIVAVILTNTVLILFAALLSDWIKNLSKKFPFTLWHNSNPIRNMKFLAFEIQKHPILQGYCKQKLSVGVS